MTLNFMIYLTLYYSGFVTVQYLHSYDAVSAETAYSHTNYLL